MGRSLKDSRVLVLGGSSGIGLAAARAAATAGAKVTIASRSADKVQAAVNEIGLGASGDALDTTDDAAMEAFFGKHPEWDHIIVSVAAMMFAERIGPRLAIGWTMGTIVSALGVWLSLVLDLPTGATIVCTFGIVLALMAAVRPLVLRPGNA